MARSRGFPSRSRSVSRQVSWEEGPQAVDVTVASSAGKLWTAVAVPTTAGLTVVRIRGFINVFQLTGTAAGDGFFGAFGIGITTDEAIAAGVASTPSPFEDEGWDGWIWHSYWDTRVITGTVSDGVNAGAVFQRIEIDTKGMRKLKLGMTMFGASDQTESGTASVEYNASTRVLVKLP